MHVVREHIRFDGFARTYRLDLTIFLHFDEHKF